MRKIIFKSFLLLAVTPFLTNGSNPIRNSSFELGRAEYTIRRHVNIKHEANFTEPIFDTKDFVHGQQSIRFDNPNADTIKIVSREYQLEAGKTYTFSFYAKSSKPISIYTGQYIGELKKGGKPAWEWRGIRNFTLSKDWERYSLVFKAKGQENYFFTKLEWAKSPNPNNDATVWFDALQINEGTKATDYAPMAPIEAVISGDNRVNVRHKKAISPELKIVNYTNKPQKISANLSIVDTMFKDKKFKSQNINRKLKPNERASIPINTKIDQYGHFYLVGHYNKKYHLGKWFFCEIMAPNRSDNFKLSKDFLTGINGNFGTHSEYVKAAYTQNGAGDKEYINFMKNSGMYTLRVHDGSLIWRYIEPKPGEFDWSFIDARLTPFMENGFKVFPVLGNTPMVFSWRNRFSPLPQWLVDSPKTYLYKKAVHNSWDGVAPCLEDWVRYVTAYIKHYKGKFEAYEIINEPNVSYPTTKEYIPYVQSSYKIIKEHEPNIIVVTGGLTTDLGGKVEGFLGDMCKANAMGDAISFHPYRSPLDDAPISAQKGVGILNEILDAHNKKGFPLWNTEVYYLNSNLGHNVHSAVSATGVDASLILRRFLIDLGEGVKQSQPLSEEQLFENELAPHWRLNTHDSISRLVPSYNYMGTCVASYLLNGAKSLGRINTPVDVTGYYYKMHNGDELIAVWKFANAQEIILTLPSGDYKLLDMYLNPIAKKDNIALIKYPIFLQGKDLSKIKATLSFKTQRNIALLSAIQAIEDGETVILLELQNLTSETRKIAVRPDFANKVQQIELKSNEKKVIKFKSSDDAISGKSIIYIVDEDNNYKELLPKFPKKIIKSNEQGVGENFTFTTSYNAEKLKITINVNDKIRGTRVAKQPWTGDSVELFFDKNPLDDIANIHVGSDNQRTRLFFAPKSTNGLDVHASAMKMNIENITSSVTENDNGYKVELEIPWSELGKDKPAEMGLDIKVNNRDGAGELTTEIWSGTNDNFKYRDKYGLWYPTK